MNEPDAKTISKVPPKEKIPEVKEITKDSNSHNIITPAGLQSSDIDDRIKAVGNNNTNTSHSTSRTNSNTSHGISRTDSNTSNSTSSTNFNTSHGTSSTDSDTEDGLKNIYSKYKHDGDNDEKYEFQDVDNDPIDEKGHQADQRSKLLHGSSHNDNNDDADGNSNKPNDQNKDAVGNVTEKDSIQSAKPIKKEDDSIILDTDDDVSTNREMHSSINDDQAINMKHKYGRNGKVVLDFSKGNEDARIIIYDFRKHKKKSVYKRHTFTRPKNNTRSYVHSLASATRTAFVRHLRTHKKEKYKKKKQGKTEFSDSVHTSNVRKLAEHRQTKVRRRKKGKKRKTTANYSNKKSRKKVSKSQHYDKKVSESQRRNKKVSKSQQHNKKVSESQHHNKKVSKSKHHNTEFIISEKKEDNSMKRGIMMSQQNKQQGSILRKLCFVLKLIQSVFFESLPLSYLYKSETCNISP